MYVVTHLRIWKHKTRTLLKRFVNKLWLLSWFPGVDLACGWMLTCTTVQASPAPPSATRLFPHRRTSSYKISKSGLCITEEGNLATHFLKNTTIPVDLRCTNDWVTSVQNLQICYNLAIVQAEIGSQVEEVVGAELSVHAGSVCGWSGRAASNFSWFCWYKTLAVHKQASAELSKALAS